MIYLALGGIISLLVIVLYFYKRGSAKQRLIFLEYECNRLGILNTQLQQANTSYIEQVAFLKAEIEYLNKSMIDYQEYTKQSFETTKTSLLHLGHELSKELIAEHKRESEQAKKDTEHTVAATSNKFQSEFERLLNIITCLNQDVAESKQAVDKITQSLLCPSGAGQLAELTLENILKSSGLRQNVDFMMQYNITKEDKTRLRPDALIFLPGNNLMVVDAKSSKFFFTEEDEGSLVKTMNNHLKSLSSKDYAENVISSSHNQLESVNHVITLMFLPSEHALEKVMNANGNFIHKAWDSNIFPVGPTGLMNMLSFAKFQIADNLRAENYKLIIDEIRKLLSSVASMVEYSQKVGSNIQNLAVNYDKFASAFNNGFLSRVKNIQQLGIDVSSKNTTLDRFHLISARQEIQDPANETSEQETAKLKEVG